MVHVQEQERRHLQPLAVRAQEEDTTMEQLHVHIVEHHHIIIVHTDQALHSRGMIG